MLCGAARAQPARDFVAAHVRHVNVLNDEVRRPRRNALQGAHAIICGAALVTQSAEQPDQRVRSLPIVVHDQNVQRAPRGNVILHGTILAQQG
jgi:hypothetical protein